MWSDSSFWVHGFIPVGPSISSHSMSLNWWYRFWSHWIVCVPCNAHFWFTFVYGVDYECEFHFHYIIGCEDSSFSFFYLRILCICILLLLYNIEHRIACTSWSVMLLYGTEIHILDTWIMIRCRLIGVYQCFRATHCLHLQPLWWRQHLSPKY